MTGWADDLRERNLTHSLRWLVTHQWDRGGITGELEEEPGDVSDRVPIELRETKWQNTFPYLYWTMRQMRGTSGEPVPALTHHVTASTVIVRITQKSQANWRQVYALPGLIHRHAHWRHTKWQETDQTCSRLHARLWLEYSNFSIHRNAVYN